MIPLYEIIYQKWVCLDYIGQLLPDLILIDYVFF